jgi:hypothetical protein
MVPLNPGANNEIHRCEARARTYSRPCMYCGEQIYFWPLNKEAAKAGKMAPMNLHDGKVH